MPRVATDLYAAMTEIENILKLIHANFRAEPVPNSFFWKEAKIRQYDDIAEELWSRIANRRWTEITMSDWEMTGYRVAVNREYMEPATFSYYMPSLLVGALQDIDFIEMALEGMVPFNKDRSPRGKWWGAFATSFSYDQRRTLCSFLAHVRHFYGRSLGMSKRALLYDAEIIWPSNE